MRIRQQTTNALKIFIISTCAAQGMLLAICLQVDAQEMDFAPPEVQPSSYDSSTRLSRTKGTDQHGNGLRRFSRAEVWQGKQRADGSTELSYEPAEILYGDPNALRSSPAVPSPATNHASPQLIEPQPEPAAEKSVIRSQAMSDVLVAHELLTRAKQLGGEGDLATAKRLTEQVRQLLTQLPLGAQPTGVEASPPIDADVARLEALMTKLMAHWQTKTTSATVSSDEFIDATETNSAPHDANFAPESTATMPLPPEPEPLPPSINQPPRSEVFRGTSKTTQETAEMPRSQEPAAMPTSQKPADAPSAVVSGAAPIELGSSVKPVDSASNQYVVYDSPQPGRGAATAVPAVTVNFDISNGGTTHSTPPAPPMAAPLPVPTQHAEHFPQAARPVATPAASAPAQAAGETIVLYFVGGLILGLGTLCTSLIVLSRLILPRQIHQPVSQPALQQPAQEAPHPVAPAPTAMQQPMVQQPVVQQPVAPPIPAPPVATTPIAPAATATAPAETAPAASTPTVASHLKRTVTTAAARKLDQLATAHNTSPGGIADGIFQENLRIQNQLNRRPATP